jgi:hypothetical protein
MSKLPVNRLNIDQSGMRVYLWAEKLIRNGVESLLSL